MLKELLLLAADVAQQTTRRVFFRIGTEMKDRRLLQSRGDPGIHGKRENWMLLQRLLFLAFVAFGGFDRVGMRLTRAMTNFAPGDVVFPRNRNLGVRSFLILPVLGLVTGPAAL